MKLCIVIDLDNDIFVDHAEAEVRRLLTQEVKIPHPSEVKTLMDTNGNSVGNVALLEDGEKRIVIG